MADQNIFICRTIERAIDQPAGQTKHFYKFQFYMIMEGNINILTKLQPSMTGRPREAVLSRKAWHYSLSFLLFQNGNSLRWYLSSCKRKRAVPLSVFNCLVMYEQKFKKELPCHWGES